MPVHSFLTFVQLKDMKVLHVTKNNPAKRWLRYQLYACGKVLYASRIWME